MFKFDFQLFAEPLDIPGIDEEILKELAEENVTEDTTEVVEVAEEHVEEPSVEADNVNKQVEEQDEFDDIKEGQTIPYNRFKTVNDQRKNYQNRIKELEEQLKQAQAQSVNAPTVETPKVEPSPQPEVKTDEYTDEQEKRIYEMATKRLAQKRNMSDEDIEALEYSDDSTAKMRFQAALVEEAALVKKEITQYKAREQAFNDMKMACTQEFDKLSQEFNSKPDAQERWNFISQERFNQLPQRRQYVLQEAFDRLQNKQGTYADIELVKDYIEMADGEWESSKTPGTKPKTSKKFVEAQKLPKAPGISGGGGYDGVLTPDRVADILNTPGAWEQLSAKERDAILSGKF